MSTACAVGMTFEPVILMLLPRLQVTVGIAIIRSVPVISMLLPRLQVTVGVAIIRSVPVISMLLPRLQVTVGVAIISSVVWDTALKKSSGIVQTSG